MFELHLVKFEFSI